MPDYVAGRKAERQIIDEAIAAITKERTKKGTLESSPMTHISIIGPRGVGKTTLLALAKKKAEEKEVLVIHSAEMPDLTEIIQELVDAPRRGWRRFVPRWLSRIRDFGAQAGGTGLNIGLKEEPGPGKSLKKALLTRLQEQSVLLLMDEVMHYDLESLTSVLQVSQIMIGGKMPLAVFLAGTPDLVGHLNDTKASFIDRKTNIRINLFNDDETADALRTPLTNCGIEVEAEALEMMVALSDNYPFFIQMIGQKVWALLEKKQQATVDAALVKAASKEMQDDRDDFYYHRYDEIQKLKLSPYAHQIIEAVESAKDKRVARENLEAELLGRNEGLSEEQVDFIVDKMQQKGFLWVYEKGLLGPGIPSFFTYVKENMKVDVAAVR